MFSKLLFECGCFNLRQPFFFLVVISLITIQSCSDKKTVDELSQTLFEVNGIEMSVNDFQSKYVRRLINTGQNDTKSGRYQFMNELIDNLVLADKSDEKNVLDDPIYLKALEYQERKSMIDYYFIDRMDERISPPSDEEVRRAYAKKQRKVYVRQLFSINESDLNEPYQRLENGEDFVDVANDYFETTEYDSLAGYLGPITYFGVDDAFAEAAYSTNQGEYSKPVRSLFGYHIVYVEYIEFPAMLTEDGYKFAKPGISSQVKLRKQRLVSNSYVRDLMSTLLVEVEEENLKMLRESIGNMSADQIIDATQEIEQESNFWDDQRIGSLSESFDRSTVLATYLLKGERVDFTFDDYLIWLPYLPFNESKNRTGASLGRALRNEVFYQLAEQEDYSTDDRVENEVRNRGYDVLSELYQTELAIEAVSDTTSLEVPASFRERLIRNKQVQIRASYWKIPVASVKEAEEIKDDINAGTLPLSYDTYSEIDYRIIDPTNNDYSLVRKGIIGMPVIANSATEGWMVFHLNERDTEDVNIETRVGNLETRYKVFNRINNEVEMLREKAIIKVDTLLFDKIYELKKNRESE